MSAKAGGSRRTCAQTGSGWQPASSKPLGHPMLQLALLAADVGGGCPSGGPNAAYETLVRTELPFLAGALGVPACVGSDVAQPLRCHEWPARALHA